MTASARARAGSMCPAVPPPATTTHGPACWGTPVTHFLLASVYRCPVPLTPVTPPGPRVPVLAGLSGFATTVLRRRSVTAGHPPLVHGRRGGLAAARRRRRPHGTPLRRRLVDH